MLGNGREIGERDGIRLDTANKLCQSVSKPAYEIAEGYVDEVPGMLEAFGGNAKRFHLLTCTTEAEILQLPKNRDDGVLPDHP